MISAANGYNRDPAGKRGIEVAWDVPLLGGYPSDRERLGQLGEMARQRMEMWSPRQNLDAFVTAVERAVVLKLANCQ